MENTNQATTFCNPHHSWPATSTSVTLPDSTRCDCGALTLLEARTRRFVANEVAKRRMGPEARCKAPEYRWVNASFIALHPIGVELSTLLDQLCPRPPSGEDRVGAIADRLRASIERLSANWGTEEEDITQALTALDELVAAKGAR